MNDVSDKAAYREFFEKTYPKSIAITHKHYVIERCSKRKLLIYGTGTDAIRLAKYLSFMDIPVEYYMDDERMGSTLDDIKIISPDDVVSSEADKQFIIVTGEGERYGLPRKRFMDKGLIEDLDFTFHSEITCVTEKYHYDVTLSYSRIKEEPIKGIADTGEMTSVNGIADTGEMTNINKTNIEGFEVFGDIDNPQAVKIVALGSSSTDSMIYFVKGWVSFLAEILEQNNIPAIIYGGGCIGYNSSQELLKFIRDVIPLNPDIVLSYGGCSDLHIFPTKEQGERYRRPFITGFQVQFVNQILKGLTETTSCVSPYWDIGIKDTIFYGLKHDKTASEFWIDNMRMMHSISKEFGITFLSFLKPFRMNGYYENTETQQIICERRDASGAQPPMFVEEIKRETDQMIEKIKKYEYIINFSDIFEGHENIYYDSTHVYEKGNQIIAKKIYDSLVPYLTGSQNKRRLPE